MRPFDDRETISVPNEIGTEAATLLGARVSGLRFYGSGREVALEVGGGGLLIGAGPDCDVRLDDPCVSGCHCVVEPLSGGRVVVRDLDSKNGTFVNGNRVEGAELRAGALVTVGATSLLAVGAAERKRRSALEQLCGQDPGLRAAADRVVRAGRADCSVLICGETGTGKELFARIAHESSRRAAHPFVAINCGAIPRELIASELFGHERGAFTGALSERDGVFVQADRGTLFLDEIGELPLEQQPTLLRVLETHSVRRVGGELDRLVDVGMVAATHRQQDTLRADLYHRLATVVVRLPPLRERRGDIPLLVSAFLAEHAALHGERVVSRVAMSRLCDYAWPGNVRELRQAVRRAVALSDRGVLEFDDFLPPINRAGRDAGGDAAAEAPATLTADSVMRDLIKDALEREGSIRRAASSLGMSKSTLADRARRFGLESPVQRRRRAWSR